MGNDIIVLLCKIFFCALHSRVWKNDMTRFMLKFTCVIGVILVTIDWSK